MRISIPVGLFLAGCNTMGVPEEQDPELLEKTDMALVSELRAMLAARPSVAMEPAPVVRDELYDLGKLLAHDKILSGNHDVACFTCHVVGLGTDDDLALAIGVGGTNGVGAARQLGEGRGYVPRNAPPLFNLHAMDNSFWDGRVSANPVTGVITTPAGGDITPAMMAVFEFGSVSAQAMFPVTSSTEMRGDPGENELADISDNPGIWAALMVRLGEIPAYVDMFEAAYPGTDFEDMTFAHAANAISGYEVRAFARSDSPFDQFLAGDDDALAKKELEGAISFFGDGNCAGCHGGPNLSNQRFFNTALAQFGPGTGDGVGGEDDFGREKVTGLSTDRYKFRSTPLRNVELTGPYGHVGEYRELKDFMVHYREPVEDLENYDVTEEVDDPAHHATFLENRTEVLASMSGILNTIVIGPSEHVRLTDFMIALTDESARDMCDEVPSSVPSGLSIDDPCVN